MKLAVEGTFNELETKFILSCATSSLRYALPKGIENKDGKLAVANQQVSLRLECVAASFMQLVEDFLQSDSKFWARSRDYCVSLEEAPYKNNFVAIAPEISLLKAMLDLAAEGGELQSDSTLQSFTESLQNDRSLLFKALNVTPAGQQIKAILAGKTLEAKTFSGFL